MFWFTEANMDTMFTIVCFHNFPRHVPCVSHAQLEGRSFKVMEEHQQSSCKSVTLKLNETEQQKLVLETLESFDFEGRSCLTSAGINMALEINQGRPFEACGSVILESGGIR